METLSRKSNRSSMGPGRGVPPRGVSRDNFFKGFQETMLDLRAPKKEYDEKGGKTYARACKKYGVIPCSNCFKVLSKGASELDVKHYGLGPKGTVTLSIALTVNNTLTSLCLKRNNIGELGIRSLQQMLEENVTLTELDVSENNLKTAGAKVIGDILNDTKIIKRLDVSDNEFSNSDARFLCKPVQLQTTLEYINMSHNNFGDLSASMFEQMISENGALIELDLSWNNFRPRGAEHLAAGVRDNAYMKYLNLSWNGFGDDGIQHFCEALSTNNVLLELNLSCCRFSGDGFAHILKGLQSNDCLECIRVCKNNIPESHAILALEMFKQMSSTKMEVFDMTDVIFSEEFENKVEELKEHLPDLEIRFGYGHSYGKRRMAGSENIGEESLHVVREFLEKNNMKISQLFADNEDGSPKNSFTYAELHEAVKNFKIELTEFEVERLIEFVDIDGDGELDFSEIVVKMKEINQKRQAEEEAREAEAATSKRRY